MLSIRRWKLYIKMMYQFIASFSGSKNAVFLYHGNVEKILNNRKSFIRYGDGEFDIMEGKSIHYQVYSDELRDWLKKILLEYISNPQEVAYFVGMQGCFLDTNGLSILNSRTKMSCWSHVRYTFNKEYDKAVEYGDTMLFRRGNEKEYSKIWTLGNVDYIIFVHNNIRYAKEFEDKYGIETKFVNIPSQNAYQEKSKILDSILSFDPENENTMVLISAGPCGKVLTYELSQKGIWAIDTGHCWDEPLNSYRREAYEK